MNFWSYTIPVFGFILGWAINSVLLWVIFNPAKPIQILHIKLQGVIYKKQQLIAKNLSAWLAENFFSFQQIEHQFTNPTAIEKIMPAVETEIEFFLRNKLPEQMPMIGMLIGDKTIAQIKKVFVEQIGLMLPKLIKEYFSNVQSSFNIAALIEEKINAIHLSAIESSLKKSFKTEIRFFKLSGAIGGLLIGLFELLLHLPL